MPSLWGYIINLIIKYMPKLSNSDILKKQIIESLIKSLGIVTTACKAVGIARQTFYEWYNNDESFKKEVDSIECIALDFAESKLHKLINDENPAAIMFYLKCKGKKRGYIEHNTIDVTTQGEKVIITPIQFGK